VKVPDSWQQVKRRGARDANRLVVSKMMMPPVLAMIADTLLVRPVDVPAPWYSVATGVLSVVVTLLLLGIALALLGMARALKGAEKNLGGRMQGLADELIPLARNLNQIATQLQDVTTEARGHLRTLSGTIGAVDDAVRDAIDAGESRLHQFGTMLDAVQDEAEATVASATGIMRGVRTGAGSLVSSFFGSDTIADSAPRRRTRRSSDNARPLTDADVHARLAALEAALAEWDEDDEAHEDDETLLTRANARAPQTAPRDEGDDEWDDEDDDDDEDTFDDDDDELPDDEDELDDEDEDDDEEDDDDEDGVIPPTARRDRDGDDAAVPRRGGPRVRPRGRA